MRILISAIGRQLKKNPTFRIDRGIQVPKYHKTVQKEQLKHF